MALKNEAEIIRSFRSSFLLFTFTRSDFCLPAQCLQHLCIDKIRSPCAQGTSHACGHRPGNTGRAEAQAAGRASHGAPRAGTEGGTQPALKTRKASGHESSAAWHKQGFYTPCSRLGAARGSQPALRGSAPCSAHPIPGAAHGHEPAGPADRPPGSRAAPRPQSPGHLLVQQPQRVLGQRVLQRDGAAGPARRPSEQQQQQGGRRHHGHGDGHGRSL